MKTYIHYFLCVFLLTCCQGLRAQDWISLPVQPVELGDVHWLRSYEEAQALAERSGKPIFILFQEVPGCTTCQNFGSALLTHPHMVEAIETYFVPLVIYNNKGGSDAEILRKFDEPSWNNPVARVVDPSTEDDILPRLNGQYDLMSLTSFIIKGMMESHQMVPLYLQLLEQETSSRDIREMYLSMFCFWSGEKVLGSIDGVLSTRAGYMNGTEAVQVRYDADRVPTADLLQYASRQQCADAVYADDQRVLKAAKALDINTARKGAFSVDKEPKYYLYQTDLRFLPMTALQASRINTALARGAPWDHFLSPRQREVFERIRHGHITAKPAVDKAFTKSWKNLLGRGED